MFVRRRHRLITMLFALVSLLFMQLAVASYACPATSTGNVDGAMAMASAGMPCAESMSKAMDKAQPGLCHAHCQADKQTLDKHELPAPVAFDALPASFTLQVPVPEFPGVELQAPHLRHATAPPVAILNCCFRI